MLKWRWMSVMKTRIERLESREKEQKGEYDTHERRTRVLMVRYVISCKLLDMSTFTRTQSCCEQYTYYAVGLQMRGTTEVAVPISTPVTRPKLHVGPMRLIPKKNKIPDHDPYSSPMLKLNYQHLTGRFPNLCYSISEHPQD
jgi:hypothetical protein